MGFYSLYSHIQLDRQKNILPQTRPTTWVHRASSCLQRSCPKLCSYPFEKREVLDVTDCMISKVLSKLEISVRQKSLPLITRYQPAVYYPHNKPSLAQPLFISFLKRFHSFCMRISFLKLSLALFSCVYTSFPSQLMNLSVLTLNLLLPHFCPIVPSRWNYLIHAKIRYRNRRITFASPISCHGLETVLAVCLNVIEVSAQ